MKKFNRANIVNTIPIGIILLNDLATFGGTCSGILISNRSICDKRYSNSVETRPINIATNRP